MGQGHEDLEPETRSHWWWRRGWRLGRCAYTFHVTFDHGERADGSDELRRLVGEYQRALAGVSTLDPIPLRWLHLTMQGVGFTDEVAEEDVRAILTAARRRCSPMKPFDLEFDRAVVTSEAILLFAEPSDPVRELRDAIRDAITGVRGADGLSEASSFHPHVSIAYSNAIAPTARLVEIIDAMEIRPARVTVGAASLIVLNRDDRMYTWSTYGTVPLGLR